MSSSIHTPLSPLSDFIHEPISELIISPDDAAAEATSAAQ
jgi:hypothetical protein